MEKLSQETKSSILGCISRLPKRAVNEHAVQCLLIAKADPNSNDTRHWGLTSSHFVTLRFCSGNDPVNTINEILKTSLVPVFPDSLVSRAIWAGNAPDVLELLFRAGMNPETPIDKRLTCTETIINIVIKHGGALICFQNVEGRDTDLRLRLTKTGVVMRTLYADHVTMHLAPVLARLVVACLFGEVAPPRKRARSDSP